jgi:hypothetical protein
MGRRVINAKPAIQGLAVFLAIAALLPPAFVATAVSGGIDGLEPSVITGLWRSKGILLLAAALIWLLPLLQQKIGHGEALSSRGITASPDWGPTDWYLVLALLAASAILRGIGLNEGLWIDEISTLNQYVLLPFGVILTLYDSQNQHMLYSLLAHGSVTAFGESAWALRLPAAVLGTLSIPAIYAFGRRIAPPTESFLAAAFLAASYHHVWFSQNARGYTGLLIGTVLASSLFLQLLAANRIRPGLVLGYALISALTVWTHMTAVVTVLAHAFIWLVISLQQPRHPLQPGRIAILIALALSGLFSLILYAPVLPQLAGTLAGNPAAQQIETWTAPSWMVLETIRSLGKGIPGGVPFILAGAGIGLVGAISYARQSLPVLAVLILPAVLVGIVVMVTGHNFWPRFFFFSAGFAVLIGVRGGASVLRLVTPVAHTSRWVLAMGMAVVLLSATTVPRAWAPKQDYERAAEFVQRSRADNDAVVGVGVSSGVFRNYYYPGMSSIKNVADLSLVESTHPRTWVMYTFPIRLASKNPMVFDKLESEYRTAMIVPGTVGGGDIIIKVKP